MKKILLTSLLVFSTSAFGFFQNTPIGLIMDKKEEADKKERNKTAPWERDVEKKSEPKKVNCEDEANLAGWRKSEECVKSINIGEDK